MTLMIWLTRRLELDYRYCSSAICPGWDLSRWRIWVWCPDAALVNGQNW